MTITILVSASEKYERSVNLLAVTFPSPLASLCSLSQEELLKILEQLQPELERADLLDYHHLTFLFLQNGLPMVEQTWSHKPWGTPDETSMPIGPGQRLWRNSMRDVSVKTVEL